MVNRNDNSLPLRQYVLLTSGLILLASTPVVARTDCDEIREEKGQSTYEECLRKQEEEEMQDILEKYEEAIEDEKRDLERRYEDWREQVEDVKKDIDRFLEDREKDERRYLDDLKDDETEEEIINAQKAVLDTVKKERKATKQYYDKQLKWLEISEQLEEARLDLEYAAYEMRQRRSSW